MGVHLVHRPRPVSLWKALVGVLLATAASLRGN